MHIMCLLIGMYMYVHVCSLIGHSIGAYVHSCTYTILSILITCIFQEAQFHISLVCVWPSFLIIQLVYSNYDTKL